MNKNNKSPGYIAGWLIGCILMACLVIIIGALGVKLIQLIIQWLF